MTCNIGLVATSTAEQTVGKNQSVSFDTAVSNQGVTLNNNIATLRIPGQYLVLFNASGNVSVVSTEANLQLMANGNPVVGAVTSINSSVNADVVPMSFATIINVKPSSPAVNNTTNLNVVNTGESVDLQNANISIMRIN